MAFAVEPQRLIDPPEGRKARPEPFPGGLILAPALARFWRLLRISIWRAFEHDAFAIAKASAYSSILTFFPALLVLGSVLATVRRGEVYLRQISYALGRILPAGSATALAYLKGSTQRPGGLLIGTSLLTIWTASGVVVSWMDGFRRAYQMPKTWNLNEERLVSFLLVLLAGMPMAFASFLLAFGNQIEHWLAFHANRELDLYILAMWTVVRWLIAVATTIAVVALIYHHGVPRTQSWHRVLPGSVLATGLWFASTTIFGWYLRHFADYGVIYGSVGTAIALLVWLYLVSLVILIGAEFNAVRAPRYLFGSFSKLESEAAADERNARKT